MLLFHIVLCFSTQHIQLFVNLFIYLFILYVSFQYRKNISLVHKFVFIWLAKTQIFHIKQFTFEKKNEKEENCSDTYTHIIEIHIFFFRCQIFTSYFLCLEQFPTVFSFIFQIVIKPFSISTLLF